MPIKTFSYLPGYYTEGTSIDSANRYIDGDKMRFYKGYAKKVGGTQKATFNTFLGFCRGLTSWITLDGAKYLAVGTHLKLYLYRGGAYFDITPLRDSGTLGTDPFSTTDGSPIVEVADTAHGLAEGDYVSFSGATDVGGITIDGEYTVTTVIDANNYTITASTDATATATGGGAVVAYEYQIPIGSPSTFFGGGWGTGTWGTGTWGTPRQSILRYARTWCVNNYGEDLIASPRDLGIYRWVAATGLSIRAQIIPNAPITNKYVIVSPEDRYIISLGAHDGVDSDPMLIRWSSQDDANDWTPTTTNTAGDKRLSEGNMIMTGVIARGQIIISTDTTVYAMVPDSEFIFSFKTLGFGAAIGPNAMIEYNGIVYWMGNYDFFMYDGVIRVIPCDVRQFVFDNIDRLQAYKVYAGVNSRYNELWWFYQDESGTDCNRYVAYDLVQGIWHYGSWERTAWVDESAANTTPLATGTNGYLYNHETGLNDDGVAMSVSLTTGATQIEDRNQFVIIKKLIPNFKALTKNMDIQLQTRQYPQDDSPVSTPTYTVSNSTKYISPRARGDEFSIIYTNAELDNDFLFGSVQLQYLGTGVR